MKKSVHLIFLCAILCVILTACGTPKPPQENELAKNIPEEFKSVMIGNPFDELNMYIYDMNVTSLTIEKRQTVANN